MHDVLRIIYHESYEESQQFLPFWRQWYQVYSVKKHDILWYVDNVSTVCILPMRKVDLKTFLGLAMPNPNVVKLLERKCEAGLNPKLPYFHDP